MDVLRWLGTTAMVSIAGLVYALFVGLSAAVMFPDNLDMSRALQESLEWGLLAVLVLAPCLGFTLVRDFNAQIEKPGQEASFGREILRDTAKSFALIAAIGFGLCSLVTLAIWIQGGAREEIRFRAFQALALGHLLAAWIVAFGHVVRNRSQDDAGLTD